MRRHVGRVLTRTKALRRAWRLANRAARPQVRLLLTGASLHSLAVAAQLGFGKQLVDLMADSGSETADLLPWLAGLGVAMIVANVSSSWVVELQLLLNDLVLREAVGEILELAGRAEPEQFEVPGFHDELERARQGVQRHTVAIVQAIVTFSTAGLSVIAVLLVVAVVAPLLIPVAAAAYIPLSLAQMMNNRGYHALRFELTELDRDRQYHEQLLTGRAEVKDLRAFRLTDHLRQAHNRLFSKRVDKVRELVSIRSRRAFVASLISSGVLFATVAIVIVLAVNGDVSVGSAAVAVVGFQQLADRFRHLGIALGQMHEGTLFLDDFERFRRSQTPDEQPRTSGVLPDRPARISVRSLGYRYPETERQALAGVSVELERGQILAVVGPNGSGKSTFAKLLTGLYAPTEGEILWDGTPAGTALDEIRARVAPVFQDVTQFQFSLADNIRFGDLTVDDGGAVEAAAGRAGVEAFARSLPEEYDTRLGKAFEGGTDISAGQWQRLAVARAFFRDSPVVVLDEPAAAVDPKQEADLFDRLRELSRDRITVFISHRFSTVRTADLVLVLDQGRVRELGTHDDLMAAGGLYAEMFTIQASRYQPRD